MANDKAISHAQSIAEDVGAKLRMQDAAVQLLGITLDSIGPGSARLVMKVRADMINGAGICHGGLITTLADSAFAFACNSYNKLTLAAGISVDFITPAHQADVLTATASEVSRGARSGVYDVTVTNQRGDIVAVLRGRCHQVRGRTAV
ncbi:MAG: hydroxyphenylacetyl-CoA thioesterase PaaI [Betaproteobacteria bacterium]|nr:MAG: hydroxyphenylacetyl-CoA thioesterase PaaI [Betaproteobacteria bacterium]